MPAADPLLVPELLESEKSREASADDTTLPPNYSSAEASLERCAG